MSRQHRRRVNTPPYVEARRAKAAEQIRRRHATGHKLHATELQMIEPPRTAEPPPGALP